MTDEARKARQEYMREWGRRNRDKLKRNQERYWERKAAEAAQDQQVKETETQKT